MCGECFESHKAHAKSIVFVKNTDKFIQEKASFLVEEIDLAIEELEMCKEEVYRLEDGEKLDS